MGRRHSLFISTDPNNLAPIGLPGQGVFIGSPGPTIYGQSEQIIGDFLALESTGGMIELESSTDYLITEG